MAFTLTLDARKQRSTLRLIAGNETLFLSINKLNRIDEWLAAESGLTSKRSKTTKREVYSAL